MKILNLNASDFTILHWLTVLLRNRSFRLTNQIAKEYLLENFPVDTASYDVIIEYRVDDSYFSFADDFLNNVISVKKLNKATRLGNLGEQFVLISPLAFERIRFVDAEKVPRSKYYVLRSKRDKAARSEYLSIDRRPSYSPDSLYILDMMRQGVKSDDPRLR